MCYHSQPPETVAGFTPEVFPLGEGRGAEALKSEGAWDVAVPGSEKYLAGPR